MTNPFTKKFSELLNKTTYSFTKKFQLILLPRKSLDFLTNQNRVREIVEFLTNQNREPMEFRLFKILEARGIMRQQLQNATSTALLSSGVDPLSLEVSIKDSSVQEEKSDVVEKSKTVTAGPQEGAHEPETPDQWSEDDGDKGAVKQLGDEEDVSFSDLEVDNDDGEVSIRNARSKSTQDACVSSLDGSNKWVQLTQDSEAHGDKSKAVRPSSLEKSSEGEDPSDWFNVDDFDFDKVDIV